MRTARLHSKSTGLFPFTKPKSDKSIISAPSVKDKEFYKMTEIEKMKRYIERTKMNIAATNPYQMNIRETLAVSDMTSLEAISFAFQYGTARGYRAAKAERRASA